MSKVLFSSNSRPAITSLGGAMYGGSFLGKVGKFLKNAQQSAKRSHFISRAANALAEEGVPVADKVGRVASKLGYGRRRRTSRVRRHLKPSLGGSKSSGRRRRGGTVMGIDGGRRRRRRS